MHGGPRNDPPIPTRIHGRVRHRGAVDIYGGFVTTYCEHCQHVEGLSRKREWFRWVCLLAPKKQPRQFVVTDAWLTESPFKRCSDENPAGECPNFERKDDG